MATPSLEYLTMVFNKTDKGADLVMAWDDVCRQTSDRVLTKRIIDY